MWHEKAAAKWDRKDEPEYADLERRAAELERQLATLEWDRAAARRRHC